MDGPLVSIIVPAKNAAHLIGVCLESVRRQTYRHTETIVVDNGSTDGTAAIAAASGARVVASGGGLTTARNAGARAAAGDYLLHIDADMELDPQSVAQCVAVAQRGCDVVILPERNVARGYWMWAFSFGKELVDGAPGFENGRFISRDMFERVGGYDDALFFGEDRDFYLRALAAGARPGRIQAITRHHVEHLSIVDILRKTGRYTRTRGDFELKHGPAAVSRKASLPRLLVERRMLLLRSPGRAIGWLALTVAIVLRDSLLLRRLRPGRARGSAAGDGKEAQGA